MSGALDHSPANIVRHLLIQLSLGIEPVAGSTTSWQVFCTGEPSNPDEVITIYGTAAKSFGRLHINGETIEKHGIQVRVRSSSPTVGGDKARAIARALDVSVLRTYVTVDDAQYLVHSITRTSDVLELGKDPDSHRYLFTINAVATLRQTS